MSVLWFVLVYLRNNHNSSVEYAGCSLAEGLGLSSCRLIRSIFEEYCYKKRSPNIFCFWNFAIPTLLQASFTYLHSSRKYGNHYLHPLKNKCELWIYFKWLITGIPISSAVDRKLKLYLSPVVRSELFHSFIPHGSYRCNLLVWVFFTFGRVRWH